MTSPVPPAAENLTDEEQAAIESLHRLAKRWPSSLILLSMSGGLYVARMDDYQAGRTQEGGDSELVAIDGIPNDGGAW